MAKSKYCYVIVDKENGNMLLEDGKLPFYWNKKVAKQRQSLFGNKWIVCQIELSDIEEVIIYKQFYK